MKRGVFMSVSPDDSPLKAMDG